MKENLGMTENEITVITPYTPTLDPDFPTEEPLVELRTYTECWSSKEIWNNVRALVIPDNSCNNYEDALNLNRYPSLKTITIGDECFSNVKGNTELPDFRACLFE